MRDIHFPEFISDQFSQFIAQTKFTILNTGRSIMFSVITHIYNKKTKGPTLMEFFTATGKLKKLFFWQLEMFDVCTTGDTAHIDTIFKSLPHTRQHADACVARTMCNGIHLLVYKIYQFWNKTHRQSLYLPMSLLFDTL